MKGTNEITVEEWLQELEALDADPGKGHTTAELAEQWGISSDATRKRLRVAKAHGFLVSTRVKRETLSGAVQAVPGYILRRPTE